MCRPTFNLLEYILSDVYFYSALLLSLWSLHAYFNYLYPSRDWIERVIGLVTFIKSNCARKL